MILTWVIILDTPKVDLFLNGIIVFRTTKYFEALCLKFTVMAWRGRMRPSII